MRKHTITVITVWVLPWVIIFGVFCWMAASYALAIEEHEHRLAPPPQSYPTLPTSTDWDAQ